ncbi:tryptophan aminotransferase-related protein 4-like [Humulus lupulus]|uniref:tryptophan aminotransferase-related protein 4-like n=1 Tax=Humulus lupulus TaxID=3486 RepID=UPI002B408AA2|nr:tryptophan aminotransferase-related protein 4-like [Humulus lupulus]
MLGHNNNNNNKREKELLIRDHMENNNKATKNLPILFLLVCSLTLNVLFMFKRVRVVFDDEKSSGDELSWSRRAAREAERVAAISCSGHGRAYIDSSLVVEEEEGPVCECNSCYWGFHCENFLPSCPANAQSGDPLFLEPFWMENAGSSAMLVAGWHRMSYTFNQSGFMSKQLEARIRQMHAIVGNAVTEGKYIIFGTGSAQLINAAVHALSPHNNSSNSPSIVVPIIPYYPLYKLQTEYFQEVNYKFEDDSTLWMNKMNNYSNDNNTNTINLIEIVTSPNNPDGQLNRARLQHPMAKAIYDRVYYWPHFTAISTPVDDDIMLFSLSKLTGHAGSRFGWAVVKDETVFTRMSKHLSVNTMGASHESQLRALHLMEVIIEGKEGETVFDFGYKTMRNRWEKLNEIISVSKRFSLQKLESQYCNFFHKIRAPSPAYAWLKCLRKEEEKDCSAVLTAANINGRSGSTYGDEDKYVRLSLVRTQDDFDNLLSRLKILISEEDSAKSI